MPAHERARDHGHRARARLATGDLAHEQHVGALSHRKRAHLVGDAGGLRRVHGHEREGPRDVEPAFVAQREHGVEQRRRVVVAAQHVDGPRLHGLACAQVAGMAVAQHHVRRAGHRVQAAGARLAGHVERDGELGDGRLEAVHERELLRAVVVVRRDGDATFARDGRQRCDLGVRHLTALLLHADDVAHLLVRDVAIPLERVAEQQEIAVLALAGRVVHERHEVHLAGAQELLDVVVEVDRVQLHAHVQAMTDEVVALLARAQAGHAFDEAAHVAEVADGLVIEDVRAVHRQGVEDGGDAMRHELAVGLVQRCVQVHDHARTRRGHVLHVVRVDVDEAGGHERAARIHHGQHAHRGVGLRVELARAGRLDGRDAPVDDHDVVVGKHPVGAHHRAAADDAGVVVHGRVLSRSHRLA